MLASKDSRYKFFWTVNKKGNADVGILLAEFWVPNVFDVVGISDRIILLKLANQQGHLYHHICRCPQSGLPDAEKDNFYDELRPVVAEIPTSEILILIGDWNGHVGKSNDGYEGVHGGHGWGDKRNEEHKRDYWSSLWPATWSLATSVSKKRPNHLITFTSSDGKTQIDYVLFRKTFRKHVKDVKIIPGEEIAKQHHLLVCDFHADIPSPAKKKFVPCLRT